ncbi:head GIN domain-containing protein [Sphingomonas montana]|uniref:head GIN domain-containing protein n=1 Tax=Sphingomonas montana TaxID=1843236 RepID=UPI00096FA952|nr:head GIN domain-containing protein [Sphingomonas montana]
MRRLAPIALALLFAAAQATAASPVTRRFPLTGFQQVSLGSSDDVQVQVGPAFSVTASGPADAVGVLAIAVSGDTLRITREGRMDGDDDGVTVTVTLPVLTGASVSGSGDMTVAPFRTARFSGAVGGSGDLRLTRVDAVRIDLSVAGSGDLTATGRASAANLSVTGPGDLDAGELNANNVSASVAGSGDLSARAVQTASASIAGSGDITIHGPARCTISKAGSGDVHCNAG